MVRVTNEQNIKGWSKAPKQLLEDYGDEGDLGRRLLLNPTLLELLGNIKGKQILDGGCGQGYLCRMLTKKGAVVTGVEPATDFIEYAKEKEAEQKLGITYLQEDLSTLKKFHKEFDIVISNMVFMDIPNYKSAIRNCINALKKNGVFIFSISHPCFFDSSDWNTKRAVIIKEYFIEYEEKQHFGYSFHRPLSKYVNFLIEHDCIIQKIVEPQLSEEGSKRYPEYEKDLHVPSFMVIKAKKFK